MRPQPQKSTIAFALLVACLVLISGYFTDRDGGSYGGDFDELVLQNPPYMLARFGKLTNTIGWFITSIDGPFVSHPPVHVGLIGILMKLGFSIYYAEATPTVLLLLLAIAAIVWSGFAPSVKLGLLFSIGFLAGSGETLTLCFGTRPEGHVHAAWMLGLVLLESGRLDNWNRRRLFAGAFFLTWASGVHYYAVAAFTGVAVYVVWALRSLGWRQGRRAVVALCAGGCLFGLPYLGLFLIPYYRDIREGVLVMQGSRGIGFSYAPHMDLYRAWARSADPPALVRAAMSAGVPLLVFSTAILACFRHTRGLALAALPLQVFVLLFCLHQAPFYLVHEAVLFVTALAIAILLCAERIAPRLHPALGRIFQPATGGVLAVCLLWSSPTIARADVSLRPKVHEAVLARACSRQILGSHARVSGRGAAWYASGAEHWFDIQRDLMAGSLLFDQRTYFSNLDAVADFANNSEGPLTVWYAGGSLQLRGFFFGETSDQLRLVYLSPVRTSRLAGYVVRKGRLYRFQEDPAGDHAVLSTVCAAEHMPWLQPRRSTFSSILRFPSESPDAARSLVTILAPRSSMAPLGEIGRSCREISQIVGTLQPVDKCGLACCPAGGRPSDAVSLDSR